MTPCIYAPLCSVTTPHVHETKGTALMSESDILDKMIADRDERIAQLEAKVAELERPIDMILNCHRCDYQHVDLPEPEKGWTNPPHKSHLCHRCGYVWRPADVPTNGVEAIKTKGSGDNFPAEIRRNESLTALLREAPHDAFSCASIDGPPELSPYDNGKPCNCWKAKIQEAR